MDGLLTVILSAGRSSRFIDAGYKVQKSMLPMPDGKTLLEWQLDRLQPANGLYISRFDYKGAELPALKEVVRKRTYSWSSFFHQWIDTNAEGEVGVLRRAWGRLNISNPILISYNDVLVGRGAIKYFLKDMEDNFTPAGMTSFWGDGERFGRIRGSDNLACGSLYYFSSGYDFVSTLLSDSLKDSDTLADVVYQFPAWTHCSLFYDNHVELGTPEEYEAWIAQKNI